MQTPDTRALAMTGTGPGAPPARAISSTPGRPSTTIELSRPFWLLLGICFFCALLFAGLLTYLQNRTSIESSRTLLRAVIDERFEHLSKLALEYGYWDEIVDNVITSPNPEWVESNFEQYIYESLAIAGAYVLDARDTTIMATVEGELVDADMIAAFGGAARRLVDAARGTATDQPPVPTNGILEREGTYFLASAVRITTYATENGTEATYSTSHVLVFTMVIDAAYREQIADRYMLGDLQQSDRPGRLWQADLPIVVFGGGVRGYFVWYPALPGSEVLPYLVAGLSILFSVMFVTARTFFRRVGAIADELERARADAERANAAKSAFLYNVSHEVRTPLNAILGFSKIMRDQIFGPLGNDRYLEYSKDINQSGEHILNVVNDLLDIAKIEAGEMNCHYVSLDTDSVLDDALSYFQQMAREKDIVLDVQKAGGLPTINSDSRVLRQVLLNVLSNAIKFTPGGCPVRC